MTSTPEEERWMVVYLLDVEGTRVLQKIFIDKLFGYFLKNNESKISLHLPLSDVYKVFPINGPLPKLENLEKSFLKSILSSAVKANLPDDKDENLMRKALISHLKASTLKAFLDEKERHFKDMCKKKKILTDKQLLNLYPSCAADLKKFDITILSFLLFESFSKPPTNGFKKMPNSNDITESDDILRIRLYRNDLAHKDLHTNFAAIYDDVKYAIIRQGDKEFQKRIDEFEEKKKYDKGLKEKHEMVLALWAQEEQYLGDKIESAVALLKTQQEQQAYVWRFLAMLVAVIVAFLAVVTYFFVKSPSESSGFRSQEEHNLSDKIESALALLRTQQEQQAYVWRFLAVLVAVIMTFLAVVTYFFMKTPSESSVSSTNAQDVSDRATFKQPSPVDECRALGGSCQIDSFKCTGSYVSNKVTDTGFCSEFGVKIVSRDSWGARRPKAINQIKTPVNVVLIHHTETMSCTITSVCIEIVKSIQNFHMDNQRWDDIGYNFLVGEDGNVYEGRGWNIEGAHTKGYNKRSVAVAIIGNYQQRIPNEAALEAVKKLIECGVNKEMLSPSYSLYGHRDFRNTISPGDALYNILKSWPNFHRHCS